MEGLPQLGCQVCRFPLRQRQVPNLTSAERMGEEVQSPGLCLGSVPGCPLLHLLGFRSSHLAGGGFH